MSVSSTEGKTFYGIVVGGYDSVAYGSKPQLNMDTLQLEFPKDSVDPYGMGRVKVLCPSLHHIKTSYVDLPWCYMASDASGIGAYSFNRPPPPGSMVEVYFPGGSKATGQGIIRSVINGAHNTKATGAGGSTINPISGGRGENLAENKEGYIYKARNTTSKTISGPARKEGSGARYNKYPTMAMREGFDNSLASKATIMLLKPTYSIFSADQYEGFSFPGGTGGGESIIFREHGDYLWRLCVVDPFLAKALKSFSINIANGYNSPGSPRNFASLGGKGNVIAWRRAAYLKLKSEVKDLKTLNDVLHEIMTEKFIYGEGLQCGEVAQGDISWIMDPTKYSYPLPDDGQPPSINNADPDLKKAMAHNQKDLMENKCEPLTGISGGGSTPFGRITAQFDNSGKCQVADAGQIGSKKSEYLKEKLWKVPSARCGLQGASYNEEGKLEDPTGLLKDDSGLIDTMLRLPESMQESMKKILDDVKDLKIHIEFCRFMSNNEGITRGTPKPGSIAAAS